MDTSFKIKDLHEPELLFELADQTRLDLMVLLQELERNKDYDSLTIFPSHRDFLGGSDEQLLKVSLQVGVDLREVHEIHLNS